MQASFHHALGGGRERFGSCMRPGTMEASADGAGGSAGVSTSQIAFLGDDGVQVTWDVNGAGMFDSVPLVIPGRQDFYQGAIYRLKLTNLPGRAGVTLYPTLEVAPVTPRTDAYLAHSPIPVQFTEEDFDQVLSGNFVTKVIYLPDPEFQELALAGVETLVSTRLDPGIDPIVEADRRGAILAVIRIGNKDLEGAGGSAELTGGGGYGCPMPFGASGIGMGGPGGGGGGCCGPAGCCAPNACFPGTTGALPAGSPPPFVAGVTAPEYGMPMSG